MQGKPTLNDTLELMRDLRRRCEWDRVQTHTTLRPYLVEEAHELDDAIRTGNAAQMRAELGDVLLQVVFHAVIAEEEGVFDAGDVAASLIDKMKRRHPHLYGGGDRRPWEAMKAEHRPSLEAGLPAGLPALHRAHRLQDRASGVGFDWPDAEGPADKVAEELAEVRPLLPHGALPESIADDALQDELGDLLFACVNLCRRAGVHPSLALERANAKFVSRFTTMERLAEADGRPLSTMTLAEMDALWERAKRSVET